MCGFLAWFNISSSAEDQKNLFLKSLYYQKKRGPDSCDLQIGKNYILGHNRLSIVDQNPRSNQPFTKDKKNFLLYNGEIYNIERLKHILNSHNIKLKTQSDTEILYEILINFGIKKTLSFIEGMFSFVYYDSLTEKVIAAKDKFGQKPLFFYRCGEELIISSAISSIRNLKPNIRVDKDSIFTYLFTQGHIEPSRTFFENINSLEAGHYSLFRKNGNILERYFAVENIVGNKYQEFSEQDLILEGSTILSKSVKEHLNADCKVGNLLSGGIDSTLIKYFIEENVGNHTSFMKYSEDIENIPKVFLNNNSDKRSKILLSYPSKKKYLDRLFQIQF